MSSSSSTKGYIATAVALLAAAAIAVRYYTPAKAGEAPSQASNVSSSSSSSAHTHDGDCGCSGQAEPVLPARRAPVVPGTAPTAKVLAPGGSAWLCSCGESKTYPFCDGSHKAFNAANGTSYSPFPYKNDTAEEKTAYVCSCGKTKNPAGLCDGSHRKSGSA